MPVVRLSRFAEADIADILEHSETTFGELARLRYERLIETSLRDLAVDANRVGVIRRHELGPDIRTYHLFHSRERARTGRGMVRQPRHLILFRVVDPEAVDVGRVLHDAMELMNHLPEGYAASRRAEDES